MGKVKGRYPARKFCTDLIGCQFRINRTLYTIQGAFFYPSNNAAKVYAYPETLKLSLFRGKHYDEDLLVSADIKPCFTEFVPIPNKGELVKSYMGVAVLSGRGLLRGVPLQREGSELVEIKANPYKIAKQLPLYSLRGHLGNFPILAAFFDPVENIIYVYARGTETLFRVDLNPETSTAEDWDKEVANRWDLMKFSLVPPTEKVLLTTEDGYPIIRCLDEDNPSLDLPVQLVDGELIARNPKALKLEQEAKALEREKKEPEPKSDTSDMKEPLFGVYYKPEFFDHIDLSVETYRSQTKWCIPIPGGLVPFTHESMMKLQEAIQEAIQNAFKEEVNHDR